MSSQTLASLVDGQAFAELFIGELGWDHPLDPREVRIETDDEEETLVAEPIASKRGVTVFVCQRLLDRRQTELLDRAVAKRCLERLLICTGDGIQHWRWPEPRPSGGVRYITHTHQVGRANPGLVQRLRAVRFELEEEDDLSVLTVRARVRASFSADEVTKRFYKEFQQNREELLTEIRGIPTEDIRSWYSSLLLNRLMFIYFMQRKGFLNNDESYLRTSLTRVQQLQGKDRFYQYYRDFLIPLFHEGLGAEGAQVEDPDIAKVIGDVPYVNGGIFAIHPIERDHEIDVPDGSFQRIFDFFDRYRWHLDERPSGDPNQINPEVLGYIFEQYVNQKQMGAYYTKEDVTGYMTGGALLPLFLEGVEDRTGLNPWRLLMEDPDRYLPEGVVYGLEEPLPDKIAEGLDDNSKRDAWDELAVDDLLGLPGESWWEVADRRAYASKLRNRIAAGEVANPNAALTSSLDLLELSLELIGGIEDPNKILATYKLLRSLRILDPTCGSGAFLFSALEILDDLYDATLARAEDLVKAGLDTNKEDLAALIEEVNRHPSGEYFRLKTAILSNLYGLDIMEEATEIARLRLFLRLVARVSTRRELEPLPDLDMNIRAGNLLVGVTTPEDAELRFEGSLLAQERLPKVIEGATRAKALYREFVQAQEEGQPADTVEATKASLRTLETNLRSDLDRLYFEATAPGVAFDEWLHSHHPFHWFIEFPEVMDEGGFDVVVGNPPYVLKRKVTDYRYSGFRTDTCKDIFAPCMERACNLVRNGGRLSMIVPISFQFSNDYEIARKVVADSLSRRLVSTYSRNPSALFSAGLGVRSAIVMGARGAEGYAAFTDIRRWPDAYRQYLFETNRYAEYALQDWWKPWPKLGHDELATLFLKLVGSTTLGNSARSTGPSVGFKQTALYYLSVFIDEPPAWSPKGGRVPQTMVGWLPFGSEEERDIAFILLAGRIAVWWWGTTGDDFHVTKRLLGDFPIGLEEVRPAWSELRGLAEQLRHEQPRHPIVTLYAGNEMGNYDMSRCRHITDEADQLILETLGLAEFWPAIRLADARLAKATGERPGTEREWPFPL